MNEINQLKRLPVAIIGGGPVGMAAAAHLVKRNISFILLESGKSVGHNVLSWAHVRVFSPWEYNIDKVAQELLENIGWQSPPFDELPTGRQFYDEYLHPLSNHAAIRPFIYAGSKVTSITRKNIDRMTNKNREDVPFVVRFQKEGVERRLEVRAVIDASGTWQNANPISADGVLTRVEQENTDRIFYGIPDASGSLRERFKNKQNLVVGSGHSAINSIFELDKLKDEFPNTEIHWVMRKENLSDVYGGGENDALVARGALGTRIKNLIDTDRISVYTPFHIHEVTEKQGKFNLVGSQYDDERELSGIDEIIVNTGSRPDMSLSRELRVEFDAVVESVPDLADLIDPNLHSCGTVRPHGELELTQKEKDYYVVGSKSYGRAPTFLMATGYEQVRSIVSWLAGDVEAARRVELHLPETGVCKSDGAAACCAPSSKSTQVASACC